MWKLLIAVAVLTHLADAQRSSYAARPGSKSKLLPRFRKNETDSNLGSRGGAENDFSTTTTAFNPEFQGTLEDHEFVHRVSQWPKDRQPFWYKNRKAISSMRGRDIDGGDMIPPSFNSNQRPKSPFQSPFQAPSRNRGAQPDISSSMGRGGNMKDDIFAFHDYYNNFDTNPFSLYLYKLHNS